MGTDMGLTLATIPFVNVVFGFGVSTHMSIDVGHDVLTVLRFSLSSWLARTMSK